MFMNYESPGETGACETCRNLHGIETEAEWDRAYPDGAPNDPACVVGGCDVCGRGKGVYMHAYAMHYRDHDDNLCHAEVCEECLMDLFT